MNPFLWLTITSLLFSSKVREFTMLIWDICTIAQPTLKSAGKVIYHAYWNLGFKFLPSGPLALTKSGYPKIPRKHGKTMMVPTTYHGYLLPHLVLYLSLNKPTIGVIIPSVICPERTQSPAISYVRPTTVITYHVK